MADLTLDTGQLNVSAFGIDTWAPGQSDVVLPYAPALEAAGPRATGWTGTVRFASTSRATGGRPGSDRYRISLDARLRGNRHRLRVPLLDAKYRRYSNAPDDATARVTSARLTEEACEASITPSNFGDFTFSPGGWINIGDRLYYVDAVTGNTLSLLPRVLPRAIARARGMQALTGWPTGGQAFGLGQFRAALYASYYVSSIDATRIFWVDPHTGDHRIAVERVAGAVGRQAGGTGLGSAYGLMWATAGDRTVPEGYIYLVTLDSFDPNKNQGRRMLTLTGTNAHVIHGVAQAQLAGDDDPKIYVGTTAGIYKLKEGRVLPGVESGTPVTAAWNDWFDLAVAVTNMRGLSPPPSPGGPLYISTRNLIQTWDGTTLETAYTGTLGSLQSPAPDLNRSRAIEWFNGELLVQLIGGGSFAPSGIYRVNGDQDISAIEFKNPFVMARLAGGPPTARERQLPGNTYTWIEVPEPSS